MSKRKVKLINGSIECFMVKGEKNPCGCGSNLFHKEFGEEEEILYGVCNACEKDIYDCKYTKSEIENSEWKEKRANNE